MKKFILFPINQIGRQKEVDLELMAIFNTKEEAQKAQKIISEKIGMDSLVVSSHHQKSFEAWLKLIQDKLKEEVVSSFESA